MNLSRILQNVYRVTMVDRHYVLVTLLWFEHILLGKEVPVEFSKIECQTSVITLYFASPLMCTTFDFLLQLSLECVWAVVPCQGVEH